MIEEKEISKVWKYQRLGDVLDIQGGSQPPKTNFIYEPKEGYIQLLQIRDFGQRGVPTYVPLKLVTKFCKKEDILIARYGASLGRIVTGCEGAYNVALAKVIDDKRLFYKRFIFYLLKTPIFQNPLKLLSRSAQNGFSKGEIAHIELPIPSPKEQKQIVSKIEELFSEVDKGIEEIKTAQQQLKVYRQAVLKWAFEGKLTNKDVKEGELPLSCKEVSLGEVIEQPKYGTSKKCDYKVTGKGVLRIPNIMDGAVNDSDLKYADFDAQEIETYNLKEGDLLIIRSNGSVDIVGQCALITKKSEGYLYAGYLIRLRLLKPTVHSSYLLHVLSSSNLRNQIERKAKSTSGVNNINSEELKSLVIPLCSVEEQQQIVQEIESRLSVCDKIEETITNSLKQAEALRQSILKKAFEGKLLKEEVAVYKPKNVYFYQSQNLGYISYYSDQQGIQHGEMTIAKYAYLLDKVYKIPTFYDYKRWHLGPYPPEMKKAIKNKKFFKQTDNKIHVADVEELLKYNNPNKEKIASAIDELAEIFSGYSRKDRSHKTELLATVCKVVEDIKSVEIDAVRQSMKEWLIELSTTKFKKKAEKFSDEETIDCLKFIVEKGWDRQVVD